MNFGLTGIGIGGLFYIGCALVILVREGYKKIRFRYHKYPQQLLQDLFMILVGMVGATLVTDAGLDMVVNYSSTHLSGAGTTSSFIPGTGLTEVRSIVVAVGVLLIVLTIVNLLHFLIPQKLLKLEKMKTVTINTVVK